MALSDHRYFGDSISIVDMDKYEKDKQNQLKLTVNKYLADTGGLNIDNKPSLADYLIESLSTTETKNKWDKAAYFLEANKQQYKDKAGVYPTSVDINTPQFRLTPYPMIPLVYWKDHEDILKYRKLAQENSSSYYARLVSITRGITGLNSKLQMDLFELTQNIKNQIGEGYSSVQCMCLHLAAMLPYVQEPKGAQLQAGSSVVEQAGEYAEVAYSYELLKQMALNNKSEISTLQQEGTLVPNAFLDAQQYNRYTDLEYRNGVSASHAKVHSQAQALAINSYAWIQAVDVQVTQGERRFTYTVPDTTTSTVYQYIIHRHSNGYDYVKYKLATYTYRAAYTSYTGRDMNERHHAAIDNLTQFSSSHLSYASKHASDTNHWVDSSRIENKLLLPIIKEFLPAVSRKQLDKFFLKNTRVTFTTHQAVRRTTGFQRFWKVLVTVVGVYAGFISAAATGTAAGVATSALKSLAINYTLNELLEQAVKAGIIRAEDVGYIQALITIVSIGKGANWDFSKVLTAPNIMKVVNDSYGIYEKHQVRQIENIKKQIHDEQLQYQNKMQALKDKQALIHTGISPNARFYLDSPSLVPPVDLFQTPEMMYAKHNNFNVVGVSHGLISHLNMGLYAPVNRIQEVKDISQEVEDVVLLV